MDSPQVPYYSTKIFWDVAIEKLDFNLHAPNIIQRVFERGDVGDIRACRRFYGDKKVTKELLKPRFFQKLDFIWPVQ